MIISATISVCYANTNNF